MNNNEIPLVQLHRAHEHLRLEISAAIEGVIRRGDFVLGEELESFEREFAAYCGSRHCIGVGTGLDALILSLRGLGVRPGDEVITAANTFAATVLAIQSVGAVPVLVDHDPSTYTMDPRKLAAAITSRTRVMIPVHLYGQPADMDAIDLIAREHGISILEDAAQAHGAKYKGRRCGGLARAAAFSFYPSKNLGALGDGGAIVTQDDDLAAWARAARNYGAIEKYHHRFRGYNSRLDTMQAAVLRRKLAHLDSWNQVRRELAAEYDHLLFELPVVRPEVAEYAEHVFHLYVIRVGNRDAVLQRLKAAGIGAGIHYPLPIHIQDAFHRSCVIPRPLIHSARMCDEILSLPLCPFTTPSEVQRVVEALAEALSGGPAPQEIKSTESFAARSRG